MRLRNANKKEKRGEKRRLEKKLRIIAAKVAPKFRVKWIGHPFAVLFKGSKQLWVFNVKYTSPDKVLKKAKILEGEW